MKESQTNYWSFTANPEVYKIEQALQESEEDYWTVPRRKVRAGDQAIIWKAKGNGQQRGIVALAEVLTDPESIADPHTHLWVEPQAANKVIERVKVRYFVPPSLPIWDDENCPQVMKELNVYHATGGSVFHVTPDQWNNIMEIVGGWPIKNPEAKEGENIAMSNPSGHFTEKEIAYLQSQTLGRLATMSEQGELHVVPLRFIYNAELGTIDIGGVRGNFGASRKFRDVAQTGKASLVADDILPPHHLRGIEIRGRAEAYPTGGEQIQPNGDPAFIRLWPTHIVSWGIEQEDYHPYSRDVG